MISKEKLEEIFSIFDKNNDQSSVILKGDNWDITAFRPFERDGKIIYSFRLYGEVSGSKFFKYNNNLQWCGGVDYQLDIKTNELNRYEYEHKLHDVIRKKINVNNLLKKI